ASVIATTIIAGSKAKPLMKIKPKPSTMFNAPGSTGPVPRSLNSGNNTAPTTIIPATRHAARNPNRMTNSRPISAMGLIHHRIAKAPIFLHVMAGLGPGHPRFCTTSAKEDVDARHRAGHDDSNALSLIRHRHGAQRLALAH